jgi:hypothetical protein
MQTKINRASPAAVELQAKEVTMKKLVDTMSDFVEQTIREWEEFSEKPGFHKDCESIRLDPKFFFVIMPGAGAGFPDEHTAEVYEVNLSISKVKTNQNCSYRECREHTSCFIAEDAISIPLFNNKVEKGELKEAIKLLLAYAEFHH